MPKDGNTEITLPTYQKHWVHTKDYGHDIVIWSDTGKITIKCIWPDKQRSCDGRITKKESDSKRITKASIQEKSNSK